MENNDIPSSIIPGRFIKIVGSNMPLGKKSLDTSVEFATAEELREKDCSCKHDARYSCYATQDKCPHKEMENCAHVRELKLARGY